jgi:hypothetical protein
MNLTALRAAGYPARYAEVRISATGKRVRIFHTLRDTTIFDRFTLPELIFQEVCGETLYLSLLALD